MFIMLSFQLLKIFAATEKDVLPLFSLYFLNFNNFCNHFELFGNDQMYCSPTFLGGPPLVGPPLGPGLFLSLFLSLFLDI